MTKPHPHATERFVPFTAKWRQEASFPSKTLAVRDAAARRRAERFKAPWERYLYRVRPIEDAENRNGP